MRILTCVKHVPTAAVTPRVNEAGTAIVEDGLAHEVNEPDLFAIEEALHQRTLHSGAAVTAVTVGPARAKEALHVAYAKGVDTAVHVVDEAHRGLDGAFAVQAVAAIAKKVGCDLILTGIQADDDLAGRFGIALGAALDLPVVTGITSLTIDPSKRAATLMRELGDGYKSELVVNLPCVLTVQYGIRPLRYTPVMAVVRARAKRIETIDATTLGLAAAAPALRVVEIVPPRASGRCEWVEGAPAEMAARLIDKLAVRGVV
jgi:electron transfer flavoprotein beta subunit